MPRAIKLDDDGRFRQSPSLPEFAWLEAIVNAVTHRSYSIHGDGVYVRQFSDRLEIQSPGQLPGLVRLDNIRTTRFSRNPHISRILSECSTYVRELNEGVPRIFREMELAKLPPPEYYVSDSYVKVTLFKNKASVPEISLEDASEVFQIEDKSEGKLLPSYSKHAVNLYNLFSEQKKVQTKEAATALGLSNSSVRKVFNTFLRAGLITNNSTSPTDPLGFWTRKNTTLWDRILENNG